MASCGGRKRGGESRRDRFDSEDLSYYMDKHLQECKLDNRAYRKLLRIVEKLRNDSDNANDFLLAFADKCYSRDPNRDRAESEAKRYVESVFGPVNRIFSLGPAKAIAAWVEKLYSTKKRGKVARPPALTKLGIGDGFSDASGNSVLHHAAKIGNLEWVEMFLGKASPGSAVFDRNVKGETALHLAARMEGGVLGQHVECFVTMLRHAGRRQTSRLLEIKDKQGFTALHVVCRARPGRVSREEEFVRKQVDFVKICVRWGAYLDARTKHNETALHFAARFGFYGVVKALFETRGNTRHYERIFGKDPASVIEQFVRGPSIHLRDVAGDTPLVLSMSGGFDLIFDYLKAQTDDLSDDEAFLKKKISKPTLENYKSKAKSKLWFKLWWVRKRHSPNVTPRANEEREGSPTPQHG